MFTNKRRRSLLAGSAVGLVVAVGTGWILFQRIRYPEDEISKQRIEELSEFVREHYSRTGACPEEQSVTEAAMKRYDAGLCPGIEGFPCITYYIFPDPEVSPGCLFRYETGFDSYHYYLVVQDQWLNVDEFNKLGAQLRESREKGM